MQFSSPIMWSRLLLILWLIHSTIARPQGLVDTPTFFLPENQLGETSGTQFIASGDTSSDSNSDHETQQPWTEDPTPILLAGAAGCNGAAPNQIPHSRSRRSFTKRGGEICSPNDGTQLFKQPVYEGQQPARDAAQPLPLNPTSGNPKRPGKGKKPIKGIRREALPMYNAIYNFPGEDGKPDDEVCNISEHPLLRVPICAPSQPFSPISMPARFCQYSFCFCFFVFFFFLFIHALHYFPR